MNISQQNFRAQGHVEVIISFVLFIGFLAFVFFIFDPLSKTSEQVSLEGERRVIIEEMSSIVGKISVIVDDDQHCYSISDKMRNNYGYNFIEVKDPDSTIDSTASILYTLYYYNKLITTEGIRSCASKSTLKINNMDNAFRFGLYSESTMIVKEKIIQLKGRYRLDSDALFRELGIENFMFSFSTLDGTLNNDLSITEDMYTIPQQSEVFAVSFPVIVIAIDNVNNKVTTEDYILQIKKW